jgi:hypothetical protein
MDTTRPLHDVFSGLAGTAGGAEPADVLRANGHEALPDGLVAEAVVTYADTAPIEVAEHLSAYVAAHSPVPRTDAGIEAPSWLDALATAPAGVDIPGDPDPGGDLDAGVADPAAAWSAPAGAAAAEDDFDDADGAGFGAGAEGPATDAADEARHAEPEHGFSDGAALNGSASLNDGAGSFDDLHLPPTGAADRSGLDADSDDLDTDPADLDDL